MGRIRYRKSGLEEDEIEIKCCYSCTYCRKPTSEGRGICALDGEKKYIYFKSYCTKYENAELIICEECNKWFRSLTRHVHMHELTISEYKERYGYNRTTGLVSKATSDLYSKYASEEDRLGDSRKSCNKGTKGLRWSLRAEGLLNVEKELQKRDKYLFMKNMRDKSIDVTAGVPKTEEHKLKISQAKIGKKLSVRHMNRINKSLEEFYKKNTKVFIRNEKGQIINSYNIARNVYDEEKYE